MIIPGIGAAGAAFAAGAELKIVNAVDFDGTNDYLARGADLTGLSDGRTLTASLWFRKDGGDGATKYLFANAGNWIYARLTSADKMRVGVFAGASSIIFESDTAYTADAAWRHLYIAINTNFSAGNKIIKVYIDGTLLTGTTTDTNAAFDIDFTQANWYIANSNGGSSLFNGCLSEVWIAPNQFLDLPSKFRSGGNKPLEIGTSGEIPTGTAPRIFLQGAAASFGTNSGTGGNFTITGTLDTASSSPSD